MMKIFRSKKIAATLLLVLFAELVPYDAFALTSGPTMPEVQSFTPVEATNMVDMFSGDFSYNIPLMEVPAPGGGYPLNMFYSPESSNMESESSWIGLGWNLNPGAINRQVRSLPDEFRGGDDKVKRTVDVKNNLTYGFNGLAGAQILGLDLGVDLSAGLYYNTYKGIGLKLGATVGTDNNIMPADIGLTLDSHEGATVTTDIRLGPMTVPLIGAEYNSREGLRDVMLPVYSVKSGAPGALGIPHVANLNFASRRYTPKMDLEFTGSAGQVNTTVGVVTGPVDWSAGLEGYWQTDKLKDNVINSFAYGYNNLDAADPAGGQTQLRDFSRNGEGLVNQNMSNLHATSLDHDLFMFSAQGGLGGTFRSYRNDAGIVGDNRKRVTSNGGGGGADFGAGFGFLAAGSANFNRTVSESRTFNTGVATGTGNKVQDNGLSGALAFQGNTANPSYEPYYYKIYGELNTDDPNELELIGGTSPVRAEMVPDEGNFYDVTNNLVDGNDNLLPQNGQINMNEVDGREPRTRYVQEVKNSDLLGVGGVNYRGEFHVPGVNRQRFGSNHIAGFAITNEEGHRYNYALPVYNIEQDEYEFSVLGRSDLTDSQQRFTSDMWMAGRIEQLGNGASKKDQDKWQQVYEYGEGALANGDRWYSHNNMSPYPYAFLITSVVGDDYVDLDYNPNDQTTWGPSSGDLGYWVKFDYKLVQSDYAWRAPFRDAIYVPGYRSTSADDKGVFTAGKKEVYALNKIITATHVAEFLTTSIGVPDMPTQPDGPWGAIQDGYSPMKFRTDAMGAPNDFYPFNPSLEEMAALPGMGAFPYINDLLPDVSTGVLGKRLEALTEINLYGVDDYNAQGANATPIKSVQFDYSVEPLTGIGNGEMVMLKEDLCQGTPNTHKVINPAQTGGKLTLRRVSFTYEKNARGMLNPYRFYYNDKYNNPADPFDYNPDYDPDAIDRWGNYRDPNDRQYPLDNIWTKQYDPTMTSNQFRAKKERESKVWKLSDIDLPGGGSIHVDYEADDYGYVQDQRAMQMFQIIGLNSIGNDVTQDGTRRILFRLETPVINTSEIGDYFAGQQQLFFKIMSYVRKPNEPIYQEYLKVYHPIQRQGTNWFGGLDTSGDGLIDVGWVEVQPVTSGSGKTWHPFKRAAWDFLKLSRPELIYQMGELDDLAEGETGTTETKGREVLNRLLSFTNDIKAVFQGFENYMNDKRYGQKIDLERSWVRLNSPDMQKYGGGHRVKQVLVTDGWSSAQDPLNDVEHTYGRVYDYTMNENGRQISSGAATYEPIAGGEEIPMHTMSGYRIDRPLASELNLQTELPINEMYYPAPHVGYREVTSKSLAQHLKETQTGFEDIHGTGESISRFYTCREFPVITDQTDLFIDNQPVLINIPLVGSIAYNHIGASQGYSIELNDMHGKYRSYTEGYRADGNLVITKQHQVNYQSQPLNPATGTSQLTNQVQVLRNVVDPNPGNTSALTVPRIMGMEAEFFADMSRFHEQSRSGRGDFNLSGLPWPFGIFPMVTAWAGGNYGRTNILRSSMNKVIHRFGIVSGEVSFDGTSTVVANHQLYDELTGNPVLTQMTNEFGDPLFKYEVPAFLAYDGMAGAYQNSNVEFNVFLVPLAGSTTEFFAIGPAGLFVSGDELLTKNAAGNIVGKAVVVDGPASIIEVLEGPDVFSRVKIIRSGRRNILTEKSLEIDALSDPTQYTVQNLNSCGTNYGYNVNTQVVSQGMVDQNITDLRGFLIALRELANLIEINPGLMNSEGAYFINPAEMWLDENQVILNPFFNWAISLGIEYKQMLGILDIGYNSNNDLGNSNNWSFSRINNVETMGFKFDSQTETHRISSFVGQNNINVQDVENGQSDFMGGYNLSQGNPGLVSAGNVEIWYNNLFQSVYGNSNNLNRASWSHGPVLLDDLGAAWEPTFAELRGLNMDDFMFIDDDGRPDFNIDGVLLESQVTTVYSSGAFTSNSIAITNNTIQNVISANATTFRESWPMDQDAQRLNMSTYLNGTRGNWRAEDNYVYNGLRSTSIQSQQQIQDGENPVLRTDGVMANVPLFDFNNHNFTNCNSQWTRMDRAILRNERGNVIEEQDLIGVVQSALFSHERDEPVLVVQNARESEILFEDFEEWEDIADLDMDRMQGRNFNIANNGPLPHADPIEIDFAVGAELVLDLPFAADNFSPGDIVEVTGSSFGNQTQIDISGTYAVLGYRPGAGALVNGNQSHLTLDASGGGVAEPFGFNQNWRGSIYVERQNTPFVQTQGNFRIASGIAHSGNQSVELRAGTLIEFEQAYLNLEPSTRYRVDAWVSDGDLMGDDYLDPDPSNVQAYSATQVSLRLRNRSMTPGDPGETVVPLTISSPIIHGWHRVSAEFVTSGNDVVVDLILASGDNGGTFLQDWNYVDDIRIIPANSKAKAYVYDSRTKRLEAVLDENHYASFLHYDDQGRLQLVKRESNKGVITTHEYYQHIVENPF